MQFLRGKNNKREDNNNNSGNNDTPNNFNNNTTGNNTMKETDILDELDQLAASENSANGEFADDPRGPLDGSGGGDNSDGLERLLGGTRGPPQTLSSSGGAGIESLHMLDSDDGADMDVFDDDDEDAYGGADDFVERSPNSYSAGGHGGSSSSNKDIAASLPEDFSALLKAPLSIPSFVKRDGEDSEPTEDIDLPTSDDEHDEEGVDREDDEEHEDDEKSSDSGEDYTDDEDEGESGYKPGGYHRVQVGDVFNEE